MVTCPVSVLSPMKSLNYGLFTLTYVYLTGSFSSSGSCLPKQNVSVLFTLWLNMG